MFDVCNIFKNLQKVFQKSNLILLSVVSARDAAIIKLNVLKEMPLPGGKEETYLKELENCTVETDDSCERSQRMNARHKFVTTTNKEDSAVRLEVVQSAINFLDQRMNIEEDDTINNLKAILDAKSPTELITASRALVTQIFGYDDVGQFVEDVCQSWSKISDINHVGDIQDIGTSYALRLRKMTQASCPLLKKFLAAFLTLTPHSMATERAVSHYNNIKTPERASLKPETINSIMHVSLNGKGTSVFDPRPAVYEILKRKDRRNRLPNEELYQNRDFIKKFFLPENKCL